MESKSRCSSYIYSFRFLYCTVTGFNWNDVPKRTKSVFGTYNLTLWKTCGQNCRAHVSLYRGNLLLVVRCRWWWLPHHTPILCEWPDCNYRCGWQPGRLGSSLSSLLHNKSKSEIANLGFDRRECNFSLRPPSPPPLHSRYSQTRP